MSEFWNPIVSELTPYIPGEQPREPGVIKLNTNENPYGPSPRVINAVREAASEELRLYPDPECRSLKTIIAEKFGKSLHEVFVGNGSDEVLAMAFLALMQPDRPVLFPDITYSFYPVYCRLHRLQFQTVPVDEEFRIRLEDYRRPNGGIVIANPNAPTGITLQRADIERLLSLNRGTVVIVDEAYADFGAESCVPLTKAWPNLLVVQTLSKAWSLAGLRIGFAIGHPALIEGLERVKASFNSYPLDRLALAGAIASLSDADYTREVCASIVASRNWLTASLTELGFRVLPSYANFLFVQHPTHSAARLHRYLRQQNIMVRHFATGRAAQFLRITVGTPEQCEALVKQLTSFTRMT